MSQQKQIPKLNPAQPSTSQDPPPIRVQTNDPKMSYQKKGEFYCWSDGCSFEASSKQRLAGHLLSQHGIQYNAAEAADKVKKKFIFYKVLNLKFARKPS